LLEKANAQLIGFTTRTTRSSVKHFSPSGIHQKISSAGKSCFKKFLRLLWNVQQTHPSARFSIDPSPLSR